LQDPLRASREELEVRQNVELPMQILHDEPHASMKRRVKMLRDRWLYSRVKPSVPREVPSGQVLIQVPLDSTDQADELYTEQLSEETMN
jgi:hypothetical protein